MNTYDDDRDRAQDRVHDHDRDPLMLVLTDAEVDDGTRADPAYREAAADVAALRDQVRRLGDVLAVPSAPAPAPPAPAPPGPVPPRSAPRRPRRWTHYALAACAAGVVGLVGVELAYLVATNGAGISSSSDAGASAEKGSGAQDDAKSAPYTLFACASFIVEGTIAEIGEDSVTLDVDRYYKPESGKPELTFAEEGAGAREDYRVGLRVLAVVPRSPDEPPLTYLPDDLKDVRGWVLRNLPAAEARPCSDRDRD